MNYVLDTHTHTIASGHAYSSIREMAAAAAEKGLELLGITEHSMMMPGTCHEFYFMNLKVVDRELYGVRLLMGVELNIYDGDGNIDMKEALLKNMDIVIASIHPPCYKDLGRDGNTEAYIKAMKNPYINIIGHPDDGRFPIDYLALVQAAKEHQVLLEVNNSSLAPGGFRQNGKDNIIEMLNYCQQYNTQIVVGSDAHFDTYVGNHQYADQVIEEAGFPEELVVNRSVAELEKYLQKGRF